MLQATLTVGYPNEVIVNMYAGNPVIVIAIKS